MLKASLLNIYDPDSVLVLALNSEKTPAQGSLPLDSCNFWLIFFCAKKRNVYFKNQIDCFEFGKQDNARAFQKENDPV